ncbi:MAG: VWA domain-containing protein [Phycisphaerae bacterium]|nr:VWA domain-containing protein [Phycisphaerae bacterium]
MRCIGMVSLAFLGVVGVCLGQVAIESNLIMPQSRRAVYMPGSNGNLIEITAVNAEIDIFDQIATTTIVVSVKNNTNRIQESQMLLPVPEGAVIRGFSFEGPGGEITAKILPADKAKVIYNSIVSKMKDPALLEFAGYNLIKSSVFPIEPNKTQKVKIIYESLLESRTGRVDYILPRSESLEYNIPWNFKVKIRTSKGNIATAYSSGHNFELKRIKNNEVLLISKETTAKAPGAFRLSYLPEVTNNMQLKVSATIYCYPDTSVGGGYFMVLAGLPAKKVENIKREVTLVIDKSGSMNGQKIEQVKNAALQIISGLDEGEAFNIIAYQNTVEMLSKQPLIKNKETQQRAREFISNIKAIGGTNIYDAMTTALEQKPIGDNRLPVVLFLTDGLPTVGNTSEKEIRELVTKNNPYKRRVFTFGVGTDVNSPLLSGIADKSRARCDFVLPDENIEVKVADMFNSLSGPILTEPKVLVVDNKGNGANELVSDLLPGDLPDMYENDQLVLLGRYSDSDKDLNIIIEGDYQGKKTRTTFNFDRSKANTKNSFVPRLWASRQIGQLTDAIRQMGADASVTANDPKVKELIDEIVRLSIKFGIMTEYTSFLATEGNMPVMAMDGMGMGMSGMGMDSISKEATENYQRRALSTRSGGGGGGYGGKNSRNNSQYGSINQDKNIALQKGQTKLNYDNRYYDANMNRVSVSTVQQINDMAFYRNGNRWTDSSLAATEKKNDDKLKVDVTIEFGSDEYMELIETLTKMNRQGALALKGEILMKIGDKVILVKEAK